MPLYCTRVELRSEASRAMAQLATRHSQSCCEMPRNRNHPMLNTRHESCMESSTRPAHSPLGDVAAAAGSHSSAAERTPFRP